MTKVAQAMPKQTIALLQQLSAHGFTDAHLQIIHHGLHEPANPYAETINGMICYCQKRRSFKSGESNDKFRRRLSIICAGVQTELMASRALTPELLERLCNQAVVQIPFAKRREAARHGYSMDQPPNQAPQQPVSTAQIPTQRQRISDANAKLTGIEQLARTATLCRACFQGTELEPARIDIAQPRWIGSEYWQTAPRIVLLLLNPGSGATYSLDAHRACLERLIAFRDGHTGLQPVFEQQRVELPDWGKPPGKFASFYLSGRGLRLDDIAFANVAWCATKGDNYPQHMLDRCFLWHTGPLLKLLDPDLVLLSGGKAQGFIREIKALLPTAHIESILHYAHREDAEIEDKSLSSARAIIRQLRDAAGSASA
jgi:hypothetical protein